MNLEANVCALYTTTFAQLLGADGVGGMHAPLNPAALPTVIQGGPSSATVCLLHSDGRIACAGTSGESLGRGFDGGFDYTDCAE